MNETALPRRTWNSAKPLRVGVIAVAFFLGVIGIWGTQTTITGAVLASGRVEVSSNRTAIAHPTSGIVAELLVESGDKVDAGDVVLRLDDSQLRSQLEIVESELFRTLADSARLEAIANEQKDLILDPLLEQDLLNDPDINSLNAQQPRQLLACYESEDANEDSLAEQISQVEDQIEGAGQEFDSRVEKLDFVRSEIVRIQALHDRGLVTSTKLSLDRMPCSSSPRLTHGPCQTGSEK